MYIDLNIFERFWKQTVWFCQFCTSWKSSVFTSYLVVSEILAIHVALEAQELWNVWDLRDTSRIHQGISRHIKALSRHSVFLAVFSSSWGRVYTERRLLKEMQISFVYHIRSRANPLWNNRNISKLAETNRCAMSAMHFRSLLALLSGELPRLDSLSELRQIRQNATCMAPAITILLSAVCSSDSCSISMFFNAFQCVPFLDYLLPYRQVCGESQGCWRNQQCQRAALSATYVYWAGRCGSSSDPWVVCFAERRLNRLSPRWRVKLFKIHHHRAMQLLAWHVFVKAHFCGSREMVRPEGMVRLSFGPAATTSKLSGRRCPVAQTA